MPSPYRRLSLFPEQVAIEESLRRTHTIEATEPEHNLPVLSRQETRSHLSLGSMPTEILELIFSFVGSGTVNISKSSTPTTRRQSLTTTTFSSLSDLNTKTQYQVTGYPHALLLINRRLSAIAFTRIWADTAFILSLSSSDSLIFLKRALSQCQRVAMRRVRFPRFMLSWEDGVGDDIWLTERKQAPAFLVARGRDQQVAGCGGVEGVLQRRVDCLVDHLQSCYGLVC